MRITNITQNPDGSCTVVGDFADEGVELPFSTKIIGTPAEAERHTRGLFAQNLRSHYAELFPQPEPSPSPMEDM